MEKYVEAEGTKFLIQSRTSPNESGYEAYYENEFGDRVGVKFGVFFTSTMGLVTLPVGFVGRVPKQEFEIARQLVSSELADNPSVFQVIKNGRTEIDRWMSVLEQSEALNPSSVGSREYCEVKDRVDNLLKLVTASIRWSQSWSKISFKEFLEGYRRASFEEANKSPGDIESLPAMGVLDLWGYAIKNAPSMDNVGLVEMKDSLSELHFPAFLKSERWPIPSKTSPPLKVCVNLSRQDFDVDQPDHVRDFLTKPDTLLMAWTRRTDAAAFERIAHMVGRSGVNPKLVIGSPEGTFVGKANEIELAFARVSPALKM